MTNHKPVIETLINSAAIAMFSLGTISLSGDGYRGFLLIAFGAALEFFKYWGRKNRYW